jgi:polar amino acid transport system substrate-binding protein
METATDMTARHRNRSTRLFATAFTLSALIAWTPAQAQTCGTNYVLKQGDTLADIARAVYGRSSQWSIIYYANQDRLGDNTTLLVPGLSLKIPCLGAENKPVAPAALSPAPVPAPSAPAQRAPSFQLSTMLKRIDFLTAEGYAPFTGRGLPEGGLLIDLLQSSMNLIKGEAKGSFDFRVSWVNDWAAHLNPLLITRALDAGVPWSKPDCGNKDGLDRAAEYICQKFFFSDPFYESVTVLFMRNDAVFNFEKDEEIAGKTLCRARGASTYDLDRAGRNWLKDGKITLMQPQMAEDCFRLLEKGTVDAVVISELTGQAVVAAMGITDQVQAASQPLNIETMHVIVAKTHPHARTVLYYVNSSLGRLRETGAYDAITVKHLEQFWDSTLTTDRPPAASGHKPGSSSLPKAPAPERSGDLKKTAQP